MSGWIDYWCNAFTPDLRVRWDAAMTQAGALDLVGDEEAAGNIMKSLADFLDKNGAARERIPRAVEHLASRQAAHRRRDAVGKRLLEIPRQDLAAVAEELDKLLGEVPDVRARWQELRWIERQLTSPELVKTGKSVELCANWLEFLRSERGAQRLADLPQGFRERYLNRLEARKPAEEPKQSPAPKSPPDRDKR